MKVLRSVKKLSSSPKALCIGNFDGMHRGHQALVEKMISEAPHMERVALSFQPHPMEVLYPERAFYRVQQWSDMPALLHEYGVDTLIFQEFTTGFTQLRPEEFILDWLVPNIHPRFIVVGEDFSFGCGQAGDVEFLKNYETRCRFKVVAVPPVIYEGKKVSSTLIREFLSKGDIFHANQFLGHPYFLEGHCERGEGRGRKLGFPTLNIPIEDPLAICAGVYVCYLLDGRHRYFSVANLGRAPTFHENRKRFLEVHVIGRTPCESSMETSSSLPLTEGIAKDSGDLAVKTHEETKLDFELPRQKKVRVELLHFLRGEKKFPNEKALVGQIKEDVTEAKKFFELT